MDDRSMRESKLRAASHLSLSLLLSVSVEASSAYTDIKLSMAERNPSRELNCAPAFRSSHIPESSCPRRGREKGTPLERYNVSPCYR